MNFNSNLVSVVIPTHNREKYLEKAILSIYHQTYKNIELIIIDDYSLDNTFEVVSKFKDENPDFDIVYKKLEKNFGAQKARNEGIKLVKGNWIAFLDSDDEWVPSKLEKQIEYALKNNFEVVYCDGFVANGIENKKRMNVQNIEGNSFAKILKKAGPPFPTLLVKRECFEKVGLLDESIKAHQEWDFSIQLAKHCEFGFVDQPLFIWYYDGHEAISTNKRRGAIGYAQIIEKHKDDILKINGNNVLRNHYMNIASAFYLSKDYNKASEFYSLAIKYSTNIFDKLINLIQGNTFLMRFINPRYWNIRGLR